MERTDLKKVLSISGHSGLFRFVAHANAGVIAESFVSGKRSMFGMNDRVTSMADISIYTSEGEISLKELFVKMSKQLGESEAPESKTPSELLKEFFANILPDYDRDKFYVSHMKKVVDWYNQLKKYASLEFVDEEDSKTDEKDIEEPKENAE